MKNKDAFLIFLLFSLSFTYFFVNSKPEQIKVGQVWTYQSSDKKLAKKFNMEKPHNYKILSIQKHRVVFQDLENCSFHAENIEWFLIDSKLKYGK